MDSSKDTVVQGWITTLLKGTQSHRGLIDASVSIWAKETKKHAPFQRYFMHCIQHTFMFYMVEW